MSSRMGNQAQQASSETAWPPEQVARFSMATPSASLSVLKRYVLDTQSRTLDGAKGERDAENSEELLECHDRSKAIVE